MKFRTCAMLPGLILGIAIVAAQGVFGSLTPAVAQSTEAEAKQAFEAAKLLGTVEAWDAFLSNYPKGFHADLARAYVKKLADVPHPAVDAKVPAAQADRSGARADYPMIAGSWGGIVRSGPGSGFDKVASLKEGEEVRLLAPGAPVKAGDYPWFKISFGDNDTTGQMWGGILCSTGVERPDLFKVCTFTPVRSTVLRSRTREAETRPAKIKVKTATSGSTKCSRHEVYSSSMKQCIPKPAMCEKNEVYSSSLGSCMPRM